MSGDGGATFGQRAGSAIFYGLASIAIIFVNKIALTNYRFPSFLCLGIGQMVATVVVLFVGRLAGLVSFPSLARDTPRRIFPLPLLYVVNLVSGLGSTKRLNLPMFTVLRRFSIAMTMGLEYLILGVHASFAVQASVGLMIGGAVVAALNDLAFDSVGYALVLLNDACTASNGVFMKQKLEAKDLGKWGLLYYNALFMLPPALLFAHMTGDLEEGLAYEGWDKPGFATAFGLSCVCGFVLNYSVVLCTQHNSALTTACVGPIKNLVVTYLGMVTSGDYVFTVLNFVGINVSVFGSLVYTYVVFRTKQLKGSSPAKAKAKVPSTASSSASQAGKHIVVDRDPANIPLI